MAIINASSCSLADIQTAMASASDGDTVQVPAGTCGWSSKLTVTKDIILKGASCTLDAKGRATACTTIIQDDTSGGLQGALLDWTCVVGGAHHRLSQFQFVDGTRSTSNSNGLMTFRCTNASGTRMRIDHNVIYDLQGLPFELETPSGVMDHNSITNHVINTQTIIMHLEAPNWNIASTTALAYGDKSWAAGAVFSDPTGFYIEDNNITVEDSQRACTDGKKGARVIFRFNDAVGCSVQVHGTDSGGRDRGGAVIENYLNTFAPFTAETLNQMTTYRSGTGVVWGNQATNLTGTPRVSTFQLDRYNWSFVGFHGADGDNGWDVNDGSNPYYSGTASSGGACDVPANCTVTVSPSPGWTTNQWQGYVVHKLVDDATGPCVNVVDMGNRENRCHAQIESNTADTIQFAIDTGFAADPPMLFSNGDTFELNLVTHAMDGIGRSGGADLDNVTSPSVWTNTQQTIAVHSWLNTNNGSNLISVPSSDTERVTRFHVHYIDYDPSLSAFDGSFSDTRNPIGTGTSLPATCGTGAAYWKTDEGNWNAGTNSFYTGQGRLYKCTATDTWTLYYTPYQYPHPLTLDESSSPRGRGKRGLIVMRGGGS